MLFNNNKTQPKNTEAIILMKTIKKRFDSNKNMLIAITGPTGSGKSYASIRIGELWYMYDRPELFPAENICFSISELTQRIMDGLPPRSMLILEEAGCLINSKDFQSKISKFFNFFMQSFRSKNIAIIFNLPVFSMMDKSTRQLVHAHFQTKFVNSRNKTCRIKPLFSQINQSTGKIYLKYLRVKQNIKGRNEIVILKHLDFKLPTPDIVKDYEKRKNDFVESVGSVLLTNANQSKFYRFKTERMNIVWDLWHQLKKELGRQPKQKEVAARVRELEPDSHTNQGRVSQIMISMDNNFPQWREIPKENARNRV